MATPLTPPRPMRGASAGAAGASGYAPAPAAGDQDKALHGDATYRSITGASSATEAEALAGTNSTKFITPATGNARSLAGDVTRQISDYCISDGATANRAGVATLTAATDPKTRTIQLYGLVTVPTSNPSVFVSLLNFTDATGAPDSRNWSLSLGINTTGGLVLNQRGDAASNRGLTNPNFRSTYSGRTVALSGTIYGDSTTNPVIYADGVDISSSFTLTTAGTAPNWLPSTLAATYYLTGYNWTAVRGPVMEYGFGAWTAAEVATWAQTGVTPSWWAAATGSATNQFSTAWSGVYLNGGTFSSADSTGFVLTSPSASATGTAAEITLTNTASFQPATEWLAEFTLAAPSVGRPNLLYSTVGGGQRYAIANSLSSGSYAFRFSIAAPWGNTSKLHFLNGNTGQVCDWTVTNFRLTKLGPAARWALQPNCAVATDSTTNGMPLLLAPGMTVAGDLPDHVVVQGNPMAADGFVLADQVLTDSRYELVGCNVRQTGTATSTITVRETSSGGSTVATGALSASVTRVSLTVSNSLLAGGKKLHLANSSWGGNTVTPFFIFRRCQMP